jgi:hypothetical protein
MIGAVRILNCRPHRRGALLGSYACVGEPISDFWKRVAFIRSLSEAELYAFAGMLLASRCCKHADFVVDYIGAVRAARGQCRPRPGATAFLAAWIYRKTMTGTLGASRGVP